jgi:hypothetical protein
MMPDPSSDARTDAASDPQERVLEFLDRSVVGSTGNGKRIDTHASAVFLEAGRALKIKRAVRLPFLDYSTLERRKKACEEELKVNVANAPELYRRVVAITHCDAGGFEIGGPGKPVEWAVEMARFDERQTLDVIAHAGTICPALADDLADVILQSHARAPRSNGDTWLSSISSIIDRNTARFHSTDWLDTAAADQLDSRSHDVLASLQVILRRRAAEGFVRRCHGDLHLANIVLINGKPRLFDAIEFDPVIATTDIFYDLAFPLMDCLHFNNAAAANVILNRYLTESSIDHLGGLGALPLFLSMRAAIRAHVLFTRGDRAVRDNAAPRDAKSYFDLACRLIAPESPRLIAIGGLSGTGKSVLARRLASQIEPPPGAVIIRSDVTRKHMFGVNAQNALPAEAYEEGASKQVYQTLFAMARQALSNGYSVVLDAAFLKPTERDAAACLAEDCRVGFVGLFLEASLDVRLARITNRRHDASDATREVAHQQESVATGIVDWRLVDASGTADATLRRAAAILSEGAPRCGP